jgi:hypothetical protein
MRYTTPPKRRWWQRRPADPNDRHWPEIRLDLTGATLINFDLSGRPEWVIGAVGLALPGLRTTAGRLALGYGAGIDDLDSEILTGFVAALHTADPDRPAIVKRLLGAASGRAQSPLRLEGLIVHASHAEPLTTPSSADHPDLLLAAAVRAGTCPLTQAADHLGMSYEAVKKIRQRAEPRLVRALLRGDLTDVTRSDMEGLAA